jgi:hypothetical protein
MLVRLYKTRGSDIGTYWFEYEKRRLFELLFELDSRRWCKAQGHSTNFYIGIERLLAHEVLHYVCQDIPAQDRWIIGEEWPTQMPTMRRLPGDSWHGNGLDGNF